MSTGGPVCGSLGRDDVPGARAHDGHHVRVGAVFYDAEEEVARDEIDGKPSAPLGLDDPNEPRKKVV